jgi:hypothetical protein
MSYYCNICRKTITTGEYRFSMDKFGKALCREHQETERKNHNEKASPPIVQENVKPVVVKEDPVPSDETKTGWKGLIKKAAVISGQSIVKGTKIVADKTKKSIDRRSWKDQILLRMPPDLIIQFAHEKRIHPLFVDEPTIDNYIDAIKNRPNVSLDDIITFAKRNQVNIRDILTEIEYAKIKDEKKEILNEGSVINDFYQQVVLEIKSFIPFSYEQELPYHIELAGYLKGKFPNKKIDIEKYRGSTKPDITIDGIAIEVKGPTGDRELQTIMEKCIRYCPNHPKGVIIVLFDINVTQYRYNEWFKGMNDRFRDVKIISK